MNNNWNEMTTAEKSGKCRMMRLEGYTWKEIAKYYNISEDTAQRAVKAVNAAKRSLSEIDNSSASAIMNFDTNIIEKLLEKMVDMEAKFNTIEVNSIKANYASIDDLSSELTCDYLVEDRKSNPGKKVAYSKEGIKNIISQFTGSPDLVLNSVDSMLMNNASYDWRHFTFYKSIGGRTDKALTLGDLLENKINNLEERIKILEDKK